MVCEMIRGGCDLLATLPHFPTLKLSVGSMKRGLSAWVLREGGLLATWGYRTRTQE